MKKLLPLIYLLPLLAACSEVRYQSIDRFALVKRHNVEITTADSLNSLSIGNGGFAFTVDISGLQTFPLYYEKGIPLGTMSDWCWHSYPNTGDYRHEQVLKYFEVGGRQVPYYHDYGRERSTERAKASSYLRQNPHRMNMGLIGLRILKSDGEQINREDIQNPGQVLDLWKGEITSSFEVEGIPVRVSTVCHPEDDIIAVRISSELVRTGRLSVELRFPEADAGWKNVSLWGDDRAHESGIVSREPNSWVLRHRQDSMNYYANLTCSSGKLEPQGVHNYRLEPQINDTVFSFCCEFEGSREDFTDNPGFKTITELASADWNQFWSTGGAVDFSACKDERALELERRVVLSRYLTRIQCSGSLPPQETGLTYNSWFGKFHLEMHWWHSVHFALWQKPEILTRQMQYYSTVRRQAEDLASFQGYEGARWPKMVGPDGFTSPSTVGNYLIWQQPHYIYFAELLYRCAVEKDSVLDAYADLVFETADFMASYPVYDSSGQRYVLGPALIPAQETFSAATTINPAFELTYWHWALSRAVDWKRRLGQPVPGKWSKVLDNLSTLTVQDSVYLFTEDGTDSYTNDRYISDHPMVLGCLGVLPATVMVDRKTMRRTFNKVVERWNWPRTWGWDYPMVAMSAAELGFADEAIHFLMLDVQKNTYLPNGHNYQDERLTIYLPGNGGLLTAVARMCTKDQFPKDGNWEVRWENLNDF